MPNTLCTKNGGLMTPRSTKCASQVSGVRRGGGALAGLLARRCRILGVIVRRVAAPVRVNVVPVVDDQSVQLLGQFKAIFVNSHVLPSRIRFLFATVAATFAGDAGSDASLRANSREVGCTGCRAPLLRAQYQMLCCREAATVLVFER